MLAAPSLIGNPTVFILALLAYNLCYMPTLGLSNTIAFEQLEDQEKEFPVIRVFGTLGWIVAGLAISFVVSPLIGGTAEATAWPLYMTGVGSLVLGVFAFTLPNTPPVAKGQPVSVASIAGVDAFRQLGSRSFYVFLAARCSSASRWRRTTTSPSSSSRPRVSRTSPRRSRWARSRRSCSCS